MSIYQLHMDGDCWPDNCPVCAAECDSCGRTHDACECAEWDEDDEVQP